MENVKETYITGIKFGIKWFPLFEVLEIIYQFLVFTMFRPVKKNVYKNR